MRIPRNVSTLSCALVTVTLILIATGCGQTSVGHDHAQHIDVSYAKTYSSLSELRRSATTVVLIRPTGRTKIVHIGKVPFTVATVEVVEQVAGVHVPHFFALRQLGSSSDNFSYSLVAAGKVYLAYIQHFTTLKGPVGNQYVIIGGSQGLFRSRLSNLQAILSQHNVSARVFYAVGRVSRTLPSPISIAQARRS
jgi:hypothetical protein